MKSYVLDAKAMVRFLNRTADSDRVKSLFGLAATGEANLAISVANWGEVIYTVANRTGLAQAPRDLRSLVGVMQTIHVDENMASEAAALKFNFKLGYGDSLQRRSQFA